MRKLHLKTTKIDASQDLSERTAKLIQKHLRNKK